MQRPPTVLSHRVVAELHTSPMAEPDVLGQYNIAVLASQWGAMLLGEDGWSAKKGAEKLDCHAGFFVRPRSELPAGCFHVRFAPFLLFPFLLSLDPAWREARCTTT